MKPFGERLKKILFVTMKTNRQVLQHDEGHPVWPLSKRKGALCVVMGFMWTFYKIFAVFNIFANNTETIVSIHEL